MATGSIVTREHQGAFKHHLATFAIQFKGIVFLFPTVEEPGQEFGAQPYFWRHTHGFIGRKIHQFHAVGVHATQPQGRAIRTAQHRHATGGLAEEGAQYLHRGIIHRACQEAFLTQVNRTFHRTEGGLSAIQEIFRNAFLHLLANGARQIVPTASLTFHLEFGQQGCTQQARRDLLLCRHVGKPQPVAAPAVFFCQFCIQRVAWAGPTVQGLFAHQGGDRRQDALGKEFHVWRCKGLHQIERMKGHRPRFKSHG